jgi:uncharacterized membrane protein YhiD involved in acid resistance
VRERRWRGKSLLTRTVVAVMLGYAMILFVGDEASRRTS